MISHVDNNSSYVGNNLWQQVAAYLRRDYGDDMSDEDYDDVWNTRYGNRVEMLKQAKTNVF